MFRKVVLVFEGDRPLGEVELYGNDGALWDELKEVRITKYSTPSDRCPPLAVLHTIKPDNGLCFKMKPLAMNLPENSLLSQLHATCLRDNKAAVASMGAGEIHLVAMRSRKFEGLTPCFWGFNVSSSLYNSCLIMLNLRCLGIVFDLDETLIVANTMRSFEDRIEALQRKLSSESDPQRVSGMLAEVKRYQDDKNILKQYAENDQVIDNGKFIKAQSEMVPALSDSYQPIFRPLIRFQDRNIILTRINPSIRDTSVLVRLRPGWEELRSYLTARGRKRFEVFVCTMAERDYALEMWRLLDPESNLISTRELLERIVCVKSGLKKSLFNVFQEGNCHPKMALVIDDRLKVWDEKDQPRVHVVPAFAPYYAPQAEAGNTIPALCVARNMACNVRGGFFKEFDEGLLQQIPGVAYDDDITDVPPSPDVSNYLVSEVSVFPPDLLNLSSSLPSSPESVIKEDDPTTSSANKDSGFDGMADVEVERRLKEVLAAASTAPQSMINIDPRIASALQYVMAQSSAFAVPQPAVSGPTMSFPSQQVTQVAALLKPLLPQIGQGERIVQSSPAREEGEVPESELDPDTRRRLLILQHGQDLREPSPSESQIPSVHPPMQVPVSRSQPRVWFPGEEEMSTGQLNRVGQSMQPKEFITPLNVEPLPIDKHRALHPPFPQPEVPVQPVRVLPEIRRLPKEALPREEQLRLNNPMPDFPSFSGEDVSAAQLSPGNKDLDLEVGQIEDAYADSSVGVLQDIATRCGTKVEFKQALISSTELQFFVEVLFAGEKISEGTGRTRREAHRQASDRSLLYLAEKYLTQLRPDSSHVPVDGNRSATQKYNGFVNSVSSFAYQSSTKEARFPPISAPTRVTDPRTEASRKTEGSINALKELCAIEGLGVAFQTQPHFSSNPGQKNEVYAQVEINGQVLGKGIGVTWEEAKSQAAEKALVALKSMLSQFPNQQQGSPRSFHGMPNKRFKPEFSRVPPRTPSSARYPRNSSPIP